MSRIVQGIDVASYQPRDLSGIIAEHRPGHVVVRMYLPDERPPQEHSIAQVNSARENGCSVGGYLWAYRSSDARQSVREAVGLARRCGLELPVLWIDCETYREGAVVADPGPDAAWLRAASDECRALGPRPGIYTGGWWWRAYMGNTTEFGDLPLWAAQYDGIADLGNVALFGGWQHARGKQWAEKLPDGRSLDRNVFLEEVCVRRTTIEEVEAVNPNIRQQLAGWQEARRRNGEDAGDYAAFREHLLEIGAPDPGEGEFGGFRDGLRTVGGVGGTT